MISHGNAREVIREHQLSLLHPVRLNLKLFLPLRVTTFCLQKRHQPRQPQLRSRAQTPFFGSLSALTIQAKRRTNSERVLFSFSFATTKNERRERKIRRGKNEPKAVQVTTSPPSLEETHIKKEKPWSILNSSQLLET